MERRVVVVAQAVVERHLRSQVPLVLREADVVLLLDVLRTRCAVVERARLAQVAEVLNRGGGVGEERIQVGEAVCDAALLIRRHADDAGVATNLVEVIAADIVHGIGERQRVRIVRGRAAVAGAVDAHQAARNRQARRRALTGDAGVGDRAAQVQDDVLEAGRRDALLR